MSIRIRVTMWIFVFFSIPFVTVGFFAFRHGQNLHGLIPDAAFTHIDSVQFFTSQLIIPLLAIVILSLFISMFLAHIVLRTSLKQFRDFAHSVHVKTKSKKKKIYSYNIYQNPQKELQSIVDEFNRISAKLVEAEEELENVNKKASIPPPTEKKKEKNRMSHFRKAMINLLEDLKEERDLIAREKAKDEATLNNIGDGLIAIDRDLRVTMVNKAAEQIFGMEEEEIVQGNWKETCNVRINDLPAEDVEKHPLQVALNEGKITEHKKCSIVRKSGEEVFLSVIASPISIQGETVGSVAVLRDITKEEELEKSKKDFVSIASHQLRTPLSAMRWYIEELKEGEKGELTDEQQDYVRELYDSVIRLNNLVNDLLNASRLETGRMAVIPRKTDFIKLIDSIVEDYRVVAGAKNCVVVLKKNTLKKLPISIDPTLIRESITNLISNAINYSAGGQKKCSIYVIIKVVKDYVQLSVKDSGIGIPKGQQKRLFQKFFRGSSGARAQTEGSGLGLYITKMVVEASGGSIEFQSKEGVGTTFTIQLPLKGSKKKTGQKGIEQKSI